MLLSAISKQETIATRPIFERGATPSFSQLLDAAKPKSNFPAAAAPSEHLNLKSITTGEAYDVLSGLANTGKLGSEEFQSIVPAVYLRLLNEQQGAPQAERFDLLAGTQSLIDSSKAFGTLTQVRAESRGLDVLKAYQANS
ncbi:hypothetical protein CFN79_16110 [Chromobacterium vaccinii]|uniref:hypothetical protein n=1 Tax=Chromobacterium vaccinii TaxID=1108595 RepID=UPI000CE94F7F|nr:hypothetical protein [Chromobacterium vaccinii]AVG17260.1 hypothetical protein CFN79_16110 [Chromobacterium vaccinii]